MAVAQEFTLNHLFHVSAHEQYPDVRTQTFEIVRQLPPVFPGQNNIGQKKIRAPATLPASFASLLGVSGDQNVVTGRAQNFAGHFAHKLFVFDHKNRSGLVQESLPNFG
jgi:hypothetical protein